MQDGLSWADFPSITDREKKLPWYHMRFKERAAEDLALERELLADEFDAFLEEEAAAQHQDYARLTHMIHAVSILARLASGNAFHIPVGWGRAAP